MAVGHGVWLGALAAVSGVLLCILIGCRYILKCTFVLLCLQIQDESLEEVKAGQTTVLKNDVTSHQGA